MSGIGEHILAMVRSHASGDDGSFYSIALQVAAHEARRGHHVLAKDIKKVVDYSRKTRRVSPGTFISSDFEKDFAELVEVTSPSVELSQLIAPQPVTSQIKQVIAEQRQSKNLQDHGFTAAHRLLLEGPPGTGKTMTASVLATELSLPLFTIRLDGLMSKFMGETASKLRIIFDAAAEQRGVYLFDEFDALGADRTGNDVGEARRILNSFLVFLDAASPQSIIVAATNHRFMLDKALFRRFDTVITYSLPSVRNAMAVIHARLGSLLNGTDLTGLDDIILGLSHADLVKAAETAAKSVLMRGEYHVSRGEIASALRARRLASVVE